MKESMVQDKLVVLDKIDNFVDGAAVRQVGRSLSRYAKPDSPTSFWFRRVGYVPKYYSYITGTLL